MSKTSHPKPSEVRSQNANVTAALGYTPPEKDTNTWIALNGATASAAGTAGYAPAPAADANLKYLRGDGTWQTPTNTTYSDATQSVHGLMSVADKKKLDGIAEGANKITVDSSLSSTSTNPVQNKVIDAALEMKAPLTSPTFTGSPKVPTAAAGTNTTQAASTAFVSAAITAAMSGITGIDFSVIPCQRQERKAYSISFPTAEAVRTSMTNISG